MQYDEDNGQFPPIEGNRSGISAVICLASVALIIVVLLSIFI